MVRIGESGRRTRQKPTSSLAYAFFCFRKVILGRPGLSMSIALLGVFSIYSVLFQRLSSSSDTAASATTDVADLFDEINFAEDLPNDANAKKGLPKQAAAALEAVFAHQGVAMDANTIINEYKPRHRHISHSADNKDPESQRVYANEHHRQHRKILRGGSDNNEEKKNEELNTIKKGNTEEVSLPEADAAKTDKGQCLTSFSQLTDSELHPHLNPKRHFGVTPPQPSATADYSPSVTLVCCHTSAGALSLAVHNAWAPIGSKHFLDMVREKYFDNIAPIYKCSSDKKMCHFGMVADADVSHKWLYQTPLEDDINWLPRNETQPDQRLARRGYITYAGQGSSSRTTHFLLLLENTQLGDKNAIFDGVEGNDTPWAVPFAELVGSESYRTLDNIFRGYENGPSPMLLLKHGWNNYAKKKYGKISLINDCSVVEEGLT